MSKGENNVSRNFLIPKDMDEDIVEMVEKRGYSSKSEFVRAAIRKFLDEEKQKVREEGR